MSGNRSIRHVFVRPRFQLRLMFIPAGIGISILATVTGLILSRLQEIQHLMNNNPRVDFLIQGQINDLMMSCLQYALFGFMLNIIVVFIYTLVLGHRVAGPQVAISRVIEALKQGNYQVPRTLRPKDELQEVMTGLDELADHLNKEG